MRFMTLIHYTAPWFRPKKVQTIHYNLFCLRLLKSFSIMFVVFTSEKKSLIYLLKNKIQKQFYPKLTKYVTYFESFIIKDNSRLYCCSTTVFAESEVCGSNVVFGYFTFSGCCNFDSVVKCSHNNVSDNVIDQWFHLKKGNIFKTKQLCHNNNSMQESLILINFCYMHFTN